MLEMWLLTVCGDSTTGGRSPRWTRPTAISRAPPLAADSSGKPRPPPAADAGRTGSRRDPGREDRLTRRDRGDRPDDAVRRAPFEHVPDRPGPHRGEQRLVVVEHRQHQHAVCGATRPTSRVASMPLSRASGCPSPARRAVRSLPPAPPPPRSRPFRRRRSRPPWTAAPAAPRRPRRGRRPAQCERSWGTPADRPALRQAPLLEGLTAHRGRQGDRRTPAVTDTQPPARSCGSRRPHRARRSVRGWRRGRRRLPARLQVDPSSLIVTVRPSDAARETEAALAVECRTTLVSASVTIGRSPPPPPRAARRGSQWSRPTPQRRTVGPPGQDRRLLPQRALQPERVQRCRRAEFVDQPPDVGDRGGGLVPQPGQQLGGSVRVAGSSRRAVSAFSVTPVSTGSRPSCRSRRSRRRSSSRLAMIRSRDRVTSSVSRLARTATPIGAASNVSTRSSAAASRDSPVRSPTTSSPLTSPAEEIGTPCRSGGRVPYAASSTPSTTIAATAVAAPGRAPGVRRPARHRAEQRPRSAARRPQPAPGPGRGAPRRTPGPAAAGAGPAVG